MSEIIRGQYADTVAGPPARLENPEKWHSVQWGVEEICSRFHWNPAQFADARDHFGFPEPATGIDTKRRRFVGRWHAEKVEEWRSGIVALASTLRQVK